MKNFRKQLVSAIMIVTTATFGRVLASADEVKMPNITPQTLIGDDHSEEVTPADTRPPITKAYGYNTLPPLKCDIIVLGTLESESNCSTDIRTFTATAPLPTSLIANYFQSTVKHFDTVRENTRDTSSPCRVSWSTALTHDLEANPSTRYFKSVFGRFAKMKKPGAVGTHYRSPSTHYDTKFHELQVQLYQLMNSDGAIGTVTPSAGETPKSSPTSKRFPVARLFGRGSAKPTGSLVGDDCTTSISPKVRLLTFIELLKQLKNKDYCVFKKKTTDSIASMFSKPELIITGVRTLLVTEGSEIPAVSTGMLRPGDLAIMIETLANEKTSAHSYHILRIRCAVSLEDGTPT